MRLEILGVVLATIVLPVLGCGDSSSANCGTGTHEENGSCVADDTLSTQSHNSLSLTGNYSCTVTADDDTVACGGPV